MLELQQKHPAEALAAFEQALALDPKLAPRRSWEQPWPPRP